MLLIDPKDTRTLNQIYRDREMDPSKQAIFLVLEGGLRIPIPRKYDETPFAVAFQEIGEILQKQDIFILKTTDKEPKHSVHHCVILSRISADKWAIAYQLDDALWSSYKKQNDDVTEIAKVKSNGEGEICIGNPLNTMSPSLFLCMCSVFDVAPLLALVVPIIGWAYLVARICNDGERLTNQRYSFFNATNTKKKASNILNFNFYG